MFTCSFVGVRAAILAVLAAAMLAACGSDDAAAPATPAQSPSPASPKLVVDTGSAAPVAGEALTLKATLLGGDGLEVKGASYAWGSSNESVAVVSAASDKAPSAAARTVPIGIYATVHALAMGATDITATATLPDGSRLQSITHLVVQGAPAKSYAMTLTPSILTVAAGGAAQTVAATVRRSDGLDGTAELTNWSWTVDDSTFIVAAATDGHGAQVGSPASATAAGAATLTTCADAPGGGRLCANAALSRALTPPPTYSVGGTISGLATGKSLMLTDSANGDAKVINGNGSFTLPTPRAPASIFNLMVSGQPSTQTCTIANGAGTMPFANVASVTISCVQNQFLVLANTLEQSITVYRVDPLSGVLSIVSNQATTGLQINDIAFLPSGRAGYLLTPASVVPMTLDPDTGALSVLPGSAAGLLIPNMQVATVNATGTTLHLGGANGCVVHYSLDGTSGMPLVSSLNACETISPGSITGIAVSARGPYEYLSGMRSGMVTALSSDLVSLVQRVPSQGLSPSAAVLSPDGLHLYSPNADAGNVGVHTIDPGTGAIVSSNMFMAGALPSDIAFTPSGQFGFVLNSASNTVGSYQMDTTTGMPTGGFVNTPTGSNGRRLRVDASGRFLYAPALFSSIYGYAINQTTGALTPLPGSPFGAGGGNIGMAMVQVAP